MKKIIVFAVALVSMIFFCSIGFCAGKDTQNSSKIGLVNLQKIMVESKAGKEARAAFEKEVEGKRATLAAKEKEVSDLEQELKVAVKLSVNARKVKEEALAIEVKELGRLKQDLEEDLKKRDNELTANILKDIFEITQKVGQERQYTAIMQAGPYFIYADKTADVTDEVIKRYDIQYGKK